MNFSKVLHFPLPSRRPLLATVVFLCRRAQSRCAADRFFFFENVVKDAHLSFAIAERRFRVACPIDTRFRSHHNITTPSTLHCVVSEGNILHVHWSAGQAQTIQLRLGRPKTRLFLGSGTIEKSDL